MYFIYLFIYLKRSHRSEIDTVTLKISGGKEMTPSLQSPVHRASQPPNLSTSTDTPPLRTLPNVGHARLRVPLNETYPHTFSPANTQMISTTPGDSAHIYIP